VFVHGSQGSAQQFETQGMRFTSNEYPQDLLFAFEYNTSLGVENPDNTALDAFIDSVLVETGAEQVYLIGHSRGTTVSTDYLGDAALDGPDKVAKCEITDPVGPSCHLRVGDGQGGLNDPRTTRDSSKEANP